MPSCIDEPVIRRALRLSRFAQRLIEAQPERHAMLCANLSQRWDMAQMQANFVQFNISDEASLKHALRQLRQTVMLRLIVRDLTGLADLEEVTCTATQLAEFSTCQALDFLSRWTGYSDTAMQKLIVVGMGKLGGAELNVSSDIDLIFVYPDEGETEDAQASSYHEYFSRLAKKLIATLGEITGDGFVFRVDMRLRPYGESGALVCGFAALENYLTTQGREWERYAWIKGRVICGERGAELMTLVRPFVYRKYLDFGAFASMREIHMQIRAEAVRREMADNIKLGPGGIREIEFIAQVFQLIRGGKLPELQIRPTLAVLEQLRIRHLLPEQAANELREAYIFLRNLEHRLQYLDDAQTQALPRNESDRCIIADAMGFAEYDKFLLALDDHRARVTRHFDQVFAAPHSDQESHPLARLWQLGANSTDAQQQLAQLGYKEPVTIWQTLNGVKLSGRYTQLASTSRTRFDALLPPLIQVAAKFANPDETLQRILQLLESIGRRESYLALLVEYPQTLVQLAKLCSASPWAAQYLARQPILLDELLDPRLLLSAPDWPALQVDLASTLTRAAGDAEQQMDILRHFKHSQTFRLLAQDLAEVLALEKLSDHLSALADLILNEVLKLCWQGLKNRHREVSQFAIIGYGKLGGRELGYASDLDIIFIYHDDATEAPENYARLAQRINTWLCSLTSAGVLYETDLRLRPDGSAGLLVSSVEAFEQYQKSKAWTWEHQALTRARWVAGDAEIGKGFERIRCEVLKQARDMTSLRLDILQMRKKMLAAHPNTSGLFDLKHDRGGIIDVEFMMQYLVLAYAPKHSELIANTGNLALLETAAQCGLIPSALAQQTQSAYRQYRRLQHSLRLQGAQYARVEKQRVLSDITTVLQLWQMIFGE